MSSPIANHMVIYIGQRWICTRYGQIHTDTAYSGAIDSIIRKNSILLILPNKKSTAPVPDKMSEDNKVKEGLAWLAGNLAWLAGNLAC